MFLIVVYNDPTIIHIYSLICHIKISQIMAPIVCSFGTIEKLSMNKCAISFWTYGAKVIEY